MDVNQKYCQSCHLISQNGLSLRKQRAHRYVATGNVIRMQPQSPEST
jgi:hypothetical protein